MTTTTTETPAEALARIQARYSKNDGQAVLQFYQAGVPLEDCIPRETILTAKAWRALGKRIAKGATAQRVYGWRPAKKTDKKTGEQKDGMVPFTSLLFHESQMVDLKAPAGTAPAAWKNPALVKAGTYDENGNVIRKDAAQQDAGEPLVTPTHESEAFEAAFETDEHAAELAAISHAEFKAEEIPTQAERAAIQYAGWTRPEEPAPAPKTTRQLSMF